MAERARKDKVLLTSIELVNKKKRDRMAALRRKERTLSFRVLTAKVHQVNYYAVQRILRDEENLSQLLAFYTIYQSDRLEKLNSDILASETPNLTNPQIKNQKTPEIVLPSTQLFK